MAANTKIRINRQKQQIDKLTWKQSSYRDIISKIQGFQSKYLNALNSSTNIGSVALMGARKATSSSSLVTANSTTSAAAATYKITDVEQLASAAEITSSNAIQGGVALDFSAAEAGKEYTLSLTLDGAVKDITFTAGDSVEDTKANFLTAANARQASTVTRDGTTYSRSFEFAENSSTLIFNDGADATLVHSFTVGASENSTNDEQDAAMAAAGLTKNTSNNINTGLALRDIMFTNRLSGANFNFSINDVDFSFSANSTLNEVISTINNSSADVTLSYSKVSKEFTLTSKETGSGAEINIVQKSGNLLNSLFGSEEASGIAEGGAASSISFKQTKLEGTPMTGPENFLNNEFDVTVNGVTKKIGLFAYDYNGDKYDYTDGNEVANSLNQEMRSAFGSSAPTFTYDEDTNSITLDSGAGNTVTFAALEGNEESAHLLSALGFSGGVTNSVDTSVSVGDYRGTITYDGGSLELTETTTVQDFIDAGLVSFDSDTGVMTAIRDFSGTGIASAFMMDVFGAENDGAGNFSVTGTTADNYTSSRFTGENAVLTVNGVRMTNNTNSIEIDGTTINIGGLTQDAIDALSDSAPITVTSSRDTSSVYDTVVKFVADYNDLLTQLNSAVTTARPKSSGAYYEPLTDEQREEMSDDQIEDWEKNAKTGLLYQDSNINNLMTKLRTAMSAYTDSGFSLASMGITTSATIAEKGKLEITDEAKLKQAIEANADEVQKLFTSSDGLTAKLTKAVNSAISTSRVEGYGSLVQVAGIVNTASAGEATITVQLKQYQTLLETLNTRYDDEMERYWAKFTQLEVAMSKYNSQSSLFTQQ